MNELEFIASLTSTIVWPLTLLLLTFKFAEPLSGLLTSLSKLRYKEFEAQFFSQELEDLVKEAEERTEDSKFPDIWKVELSAHVQELASARPDIAIMDAWKATEVGMAKVLEARQLIKEVSRFEPPSRIIRILRENNLIDDRQTALAHQLRELRHQVAHDSNPQSWVSTEMALEYSRLCKALLSQIESSR